MSSRLQFQLLAKDSWSSARHTRVQVRGKEFETPIFMPVATQAALRGLDVSEVEKLRYRVLLANTYHLLLRPGPERVSHFGGLHKFMQWPGLILTDSGGFQIFSLSRQLRIDDEAARFRSYVDGKIIHLNPEESIATQMALDSDIMMVLDHCVASTSPLALVQEALQRTTSWARRSLAARREDSEQALFGIVQGACSKELRIRSAEEITSLPFDGFAIGGLAVGEGRAEREDMTELATGLLPIDRPRYLMGVGTPIDLLEAIKRGVDMFDCILPTSLAHQGVAFTSQGRIHLRHARYADSEEFLDPDCSCSTCLRFSRGYLHHLARVREFILDQMISIHNLHFYQKLIENIRQSLREGVFQECYEFYKPVLEATDSSGETPPSPRSREKKPWTLGAYEVSLDDEHVARIRHRSSGERMHSVRKPTEEAQELYVEQSGLIERVKLPGSSICIWDIGLGAATNAMQSILSMEAAGCLGNLEIESFENDLDSLRLALEHPDKFKHIRHPAPFALIREGVWKQESSEGKANIHWRLWEGNFQEKIAQAEKPDIIFFDPFSTKVDRKAWTLDVFEALYRNTSSQPCLLITYSSSTAVRATLLASGWYLGKGMRTGPKESTTLAWNLSMQTSPIRQHFYSSIPLFGKEWLARWERSDAQFLPDVLERDADHVASLKEKIRSHAQFALSDEESRGENTF